MTKAAPHPPASDITLPPISSDDVRFLTDNPNTIDLIEWVNNHARLAVEQDRAKRGEPVARIGDYPSELIRPAWPSASDGEKLWLWKNGDHFLAYRHLYPCVSKGGDPLTLGEPVGYAIFGKSFGRMCDEEPKPTKKQIDAYRAGAEAMRERAAKVAEHYSHEPAACSDHIRALPIDSPTS